MSFNYNHPDHSCSYCGDPPRLDNHCTECGKHLPVDPYRFVPSISYRCLGKEVDGKWKCDYPFRG